MANQQRVKEVAHVLLFIKESRAQAGELESDTKKLEQSAKDMLAGISEKNPDKIAKAIKVIVDFIEKHIGR